MNKEQYLKQDEMTEIAALVEFLVGRKDDSYTYVKAVILTDAGGEDLGSIEIVPGDGTYAYYPNA